MWFPIIAILLSYLLGSISTSIILCKLTNQPDPRTQGSKNPGATNVLRLVGKKLALCTLAGDMAKGFLAILIGRILGQEGLILSLCAVAVLLGHIYPIFFKFQGGKGVATGLGAFIGLSPLLGIAATVTWLIMAMVFRYSSLAALITFTLAPLYTVLFGRPAYLFPLIAMTLLIFWRHRSNLERLKAGTEDKIKLS